MSLIRVLILLGGLLGANALFAGFINDSLGFVSPVDHEIKLTGNFMELRTNHFHAGIDIKSTNGQVGDAIKSVHNGHVSRIKVQTGGYGNALYIDHPNGYTSVYAHLHEYTGPIEDFVKEVQYKTESYEVDIYLPDSLFRFDKGELIGQMGNSGRSFGPHLHFELRKTAQEEPVNPECLGIGPSDSRAPVLESLHLHYVGEEGEVHNKEVKYFKTKGPNYSLYDNEMIVNADRVGFGLQMYDRMDGSWNKNGVYSYQVKVDGQTVFSWKADKFSFDETRYINAFWDYERHWSHGQKIYLMYRQACNPFSYYEGQTDGVVDISDGQSKEIEIIVADLHKNESTIQFKIAGEEPSQRVINHVNCDSTVQRTIGSFTVSMPQNAFYAPTKLAITSGKVKVGSQQCEAITIGESITSVNGYYQISCKAPSSDLQSYTLVSKDKKGRWVHFGGDTLEGRFVGHVDQLGTFALYKDEIVPKVEVISCSASYSSPWKFRITDNLIDDGYAQELNYRASVNGSWMRMIFDKKNDLLIFEDFSKLPNKPFILQLEVWDHCQNVCTYTKRF